MNQNLRLRIEESINSKIISPNLLFISLACLNEKIVYSPLVHHNLEKQRNIIAKTALNNGILKENIALKIKTITKKIDKIKLMVIITVK